MREPETPINRHLQRRPIAERIFARMASHGARALDLREVDQIATYSVMAADRLVAALNVKFE